MPFTAFINAKLVLPHTVEENGTLLTQDGVIVPLGETLKIPADAEVIDVAGQFLAPGFVDIHVHGGAGADFMDLTPEAFHTVCECHARHGTTSLTPTSTVSTVEDCLQFLQLCADLYGNTRGARNVGGHLYGPYFAKPAKGCHPNLTFLEPAKENWEPFLKFAGKGLKTLTVAPELPNVLELIHVFVNAGVGVNVGHSYATYAQVEAAHKAGATHVDHLFCAMSDRARLRLSQAFPMRAGVLEATLANPSLTTEIIADGWHLDDSLIKVAWLVKGRDSLALVTDSMRAVDCPDGEYWFGPDGRGEKIRRKGEVGVTLDGSGLASSVMGMDHMLRVFMRATGESIVEAVRCASTNPARFLGLEHEIGMLKPGLRADLVTLNSAYEVAGVWVGGKKV